MSTAEFALAVFASAFIATAIYGLQLAIQNGYDERNFRLLLATSPDLRGFSPPRDSKDIPLGGPFSLQNVHLRAKHLGTSDLRYVNLSNADLQYTHLGGSTLSRANLTDAELKSAYLWYADLRCANFHRANLYGADLRNADLRGANLQEADLRYSDMRGALMDGDDAQLKGAKLEGACRPGDPYRAACAEEAGIGFEHTAGRNATLRPVTSKKAGCPYAFEPSDSAD